MPTEPSRAAQDRWCDADGTRIALFRWVEQVTEHPDHGPPLSRLHQHGQVLGRGPGVVYVRFQGEDQLISVAPRLLRMLPDQPDRR
jgi:hypothetical protein